MFGSMKTYLSDQLQQIRDAGLFKGERVITTPQNARVGVLNQQPVLNLCANNYLGLADHPEIVAAAHEALDKWGYGMATVRFICGTQQIHKHLEARLSSSSARTTPSSTRPASMPTAACSRRFSARKTPSSPTS